MQRHLNHRSLAKGPSHLILIGSDMYNNIHSAIDRLLVEDVDGWRVKSLPALFADMLEGKDVSTAYME